MSVSNQPPIDPDANEPDRTRLIARPVASGTFPPGSMLANTYQVETLMARGGMGEVYRARHAELGTEHAIKIILPELANNPKVVDLFRREASILRTIRNEVIVGYDGVFRDESGRLYLVMEYVDGQSLSSIMRNRPLSSDEVRRLRHRLAIGLAAAHEKGVIHRDLSPDNIIIPGEQIDHAKIIDFGIAKMVEPNARTIIGDDFAGKYSYVSPEQLGMFGGVVDARSDIYSMGLVLAAAAIGEPLDMGMTPISVVEARRSVPNLSRVPTELREELAALLQPNPRDRVQTMAAVADDDPVAAIFSGSKSERRHEQRRGGRKRTRSEHLPQSDQTMINRKSLGWAITALLLFLVLGGAGYFYWLQLPSEQPEPGGQFATPSTSAPPPPQQPSSVAPATSAPESAAASPPPIQPATATPTLAPQAAAPEPTPMLGTTTPTPSQEVDATIAPPTASATSPEVAALSPAATPPSAPSDLTALKQAAETVASGFSCSKLDVDPSTPGQLVVSGHVSSEQDKARIAMAYGDIAAGRTIIDRVEIQQWPFCEAMGTLETQSSYKPGDAVTPQIDLGGRNGTYSEGDKLLLTIRNTPLFDGYLYVDYLDPDGNVLHLLPNPAQPDNQVAAGASVVIGAGPKVYTVSPPFGRQMILAFAAPRPLFETRRPETELAKDYLPFLRKSLGTAMVAGYQNSLVGSYGFLRFDPR